MGPPTSPGPADPLTQFRSYLNVLADPTAKDESKLKAVQELNENLEAVIASPLYAQYLEHSMKIFLRILQDGEPHFIAEYNIQQVRKMILEIIHRLPTNDGMKPFVKQLLALMFKEVETDNEENVLVCLRIIIELHKQFRPPYSPEIPAFLSLVKSIYRNLPNHVSKIFDPKMPLKVRDLSDLNLDALLSETFTITTVQTEVKTQDGTNVSYNVLPRASMSLKVLQELPIIVVLMYQLYKANIHADVAEFIPLIMNTITMAPSQQMRNSPSFQKEIFVDFMGAQIKTLSFLAYILKYYQDAISQQANAMVKGVLSMLVLCPMEVAHLRKELLIAARHILATDLKVKFVPVMERLFDENLLLGRGWTANESLRPLAYSTVADLVHHVRTQLPLVDLSRAVYLFSRNVHDDTLPVNIQTMSVKLLLNLVDCIHRRSEVEAGNGRDLLVRMLETFVLKLKSIVKHQLPVLAEKNKAVVLTQGVSANLVCPTPSAHTAPATPATPSPASPSPFASPATPMVETIKSEDIKGFSIDTTLKEEKDKVKFGFPTSQVPNYTINDCRGLVKTLVCAVKTATWGCTSTKGTETLPTAQTTKSFQPKETLLFIRLVKWGLQALDVYTLNGTPVPVTQSVGVGSNGRPAAQPQQSVRTKDEKEALEHFAGVFSMLSPQNFKEIFSSTIEIFVERVYKNFALQLVANSFLANQATSSIFATILVEYLLSRMEDMGASIERSNLYLKLFKLVFGSVQLFAQENEQMLKPYLHKIVNRSMELALTAKEPYNYFLLLRALFRSIGGGSHDLLYQEFLPLLPTLLQGLNSLQSGLHKQHMKDLFVELCLTVPVRLSSLLPYLPMLMDPLVSALNGSQTLVSQGLRTLELCVDNLQPDFLYEHIQPVRAELMQALWRTLRSPNDSIALSAFRVLGKFGGGNRKMLIEAQALEYNDKESVGPCIQLHFPDHKPAVNLPVEKIIETAFNALKSSSTDPFYRRQCWETVRCYLACSLQLDDEKHVLQNFLTHQAFTDSEIFNVQTPAVRCTDAQARNTQQMAVTAMFIAAAIKELRQSVLKTMVALVRHYTLVAIAQQAGPFPLAVPGKPPSRISGLDPVVLIDALATIMGHEEKELCKPGHLALVLILGTAVTVLGSKERACKLRFMECLAEKMCGLCYERAWYSKLGGCIAIKFLFERMALKWVLDHQFIFLKALLFVMMDLSGEVSSGALDMAKSNLEKMITLCATPLEISIATDDMLAAQRKSLHDVTLELVRQVTSPNNCVREQAMKSLQLIALLIGQTVTSVMEPHKDILADMIPPKKHLLRHQPVNAQIGLMDGNTFCTTLEPRLFTIDLNIMEHKVFFSELFSLCEAEDSALQKFPCYKSVTDLTPLRKSALRALAACHYVSQCKEKIFSLLYKSLSSTNPELQEAAFDCLKSFTAGCQVEMETVHLNVRQLLVHLNDFRQLTPNIIQRLSYTTQLFPNTFNEKLCEQMLQHLRKWLEVLIVQNKPASGRSVLLNSSSNEVKVATEIIALFHQIPAASARFLEILCKLVLQTERATGMEAGSPFRDSLMKFLLRYPQETIDLFLKEETVMDQQWSRYFHYMVKHIDGKELRDRLQFQTDRLIQMAITGIQPVQGAQTQLVVTTAAGAQQNKASLLYQSIRIVDALAKHDTTWLGQQHDLITVLRKIWISDEFQDNHMKIENVDYSHWKDAKTLVKILLDYFKAQPSETDLLFDVMRCLNGHHVPDFQFVKEYLETQVWNYDSEWKRLVFFRFVELFRDAETTMEHKAILLQHVIIPCFATSFEKDQGEMLIGSPPMPEQDNAENLVSVFINRVVDPENPFGTTDAVRILLLQLSCLLVDKAAPHIHDAGNKRQGNKLRRLMTYAWPCLLSKNCVDPTTRYHGHLLLSHIISKFAIHKRIVLQVFHSLLKAHAVEARTVVRQALEILTPAMPIRMEDGNTMLTHWTKKIIVEEGHSINQLVHILQLVVRHYKVYYPVRHHLVHHMVSSMQKLGFAPTASTEQKKLAVDLAEVVLKWEQQRIQEEQDIEMPDIKRPKLQTTPKGENRPIEKIHADATVNFLLRLACQTAEASQATPPVANPQDSISKRCVALLKIALRSDVWPQVEFKLSWLERLFTATGDSGAAAVPNQNSICTALEMLTFLLGILRNEQILSCIKPLQRGIATCTQSTNLKVIRAVHPLLMKLMQLFPTEPTNSNIASKHEELETLYASVSKYIYEGLNTFDKNSNALPSTLLGTLLMLKAACVNNVCYVDRLITSFMRVLHRLHREHVTPSSTSGAENTALCVELLITSLEIVKNRVGVMGMEMRKAFIGTILVGLIEKTPDNKVMKTVVKMLDEWIRTKNTIEINQGPSLREKAILLVKLMQYVEKRFPDDLELNASFLELVNYIYRDEAMRGSELTAKLEPAFLAGLRCTQPHIRNKFFEVFDSSIKRKLFERLLYVVCSQNWEQIGPHYWIKQCVELIFVCTVGTNQLQCAPGTPLLPSVTSVISIADPAERSNFTAVSTIKEEPMDFDSFFDREDKDCKMRASLSFEDEIDMELSNAPGDGSHSVDIKFPTDHRAAIVSMVSRQAKFLEDSKAVKTGDFLSSAAQLAHMETSLAETLWIDMFPRLWKVLAERQQQTLAGELVPFLCSGAHVLQKDCQPSALQTFVEALTLCSPPVPMKPCILKYLGKAHNLWHRMTLALEQVVFDQSVPGSIVKTKRDPTECYEFEPPVTPQLEVMDSLSELYSLLREEDVWASLWQKKAKYPETAMAVAYEQMGFFEQAQGAYELATSKARADYANNPVPVSMQSEYKLLEEHWIRCSKELNQWDLLQEYGSSEGASNPQLVLESSWRVPNWPLMKEALSQVELSCPKEIAWKVNLYRGFLAICHPEDQHLTLVERYVELASTLCIKEWRRLPTVVSHIHIPLLQAAQQVVELHEASTIHQGLLQNRSTSLHDMKAIVKTWRNRLPVIADDLSHWSDVFAWRQHHYQFIASHFEQQQPEQTNAAGHSMLGVHASALAIIHFGKIARKHSLTGVCLESLSRIYTIPSVPIVDCFQKIRQQVKCYLQMALMHGKNELQEGLEVIDSTNLKYFTKEMTAEFYAYKGLMLSQLGRSDDANKAFSAAVQLHDNLTKGWAFWGDYLEQVFTKDSKNITLGVSAVTCYLHACRHQNEPKARKYLAKVLWLLSYDDEKLQIAEALDKYSVGVPAVHWLPWIPQLLNALVRNEGKLILNLLIQVGRMFPQAVYFPIRTLYLTLKIEQRERVKAAEQASPAHSAQPQTPGSSQGIDVGTAGQEGGPGGPIRATQPMWRCSRIMHTQRDLHPTVLSSLEGIVDQMVWFRESWYEEVLRQLRLGLAKCYAIAFETRVNVAEATITPHTLNFVRKLVSTFGIGIENIASSAGGSFGSSASESLARRAQMTAQDPVFQRMKTQFSTDFDFSQPGSMKLHNLIHKLKKWIKILEAKTKLLPRSFLIEEKCRFLSNFSQQTAEVEMPGEFLLPKHAHYFVRIARFLPRVEIVPKHNTAARRLFIRGHNGKIYPFLVVNDSCIGDARREERILQLFRMLNHYLAKQKETSRRLLHFTVPRVVAVSPQMRLVEDNPSSLSLLDIYRQRSAKRGVEHDTPITKYYERLASVQSRGAQANHQVLKDILKEVQNVMVPKTLISDWAASTFPSPTAYWSFRKMFTVHLALIDFAEYVFHLTRLNPDMMYVHQDSGLMNVSYFKWDMDDETGVLEGGRPVPFRLTPNLTEFITPLAVSGPLTAAMIATARCLSYAPYKLQSILRAMLRDEVIGWHRKKCSDNDGCPPEKDTESDVIVTGVSKAVSQIMNRLQSLSTYDGIDNKVSTLVAAASTQDKLCLMDPAWHPWL